MRLRRFAFAKRMATAFIATLSIASASLAYDVAGMRDAMYSVFSSMRVLLELSVDPATLAAPGNRRKVLAAAGDLEEQASLISGHVPRDEVSFLASSLDRYALWIRKSYEWGLYRDTQQLIHDTVDVCIACHTRLPSRRDSPLAKDFLDEQQMMKLPARERARVQTATRRFDDALAGYTALMENSLHGDDFDSLAREYLVLVLRVKNDPRRAQDLLERLAQQADIDVHRRARLTAWARSLRKLAAVPLHRADVKAAQRLVDEAESALGSDGDEWLVNYIVASRLLYGYLFDDSPGTLEEGAQAYWLLGLTQYRINANAWLPQAELYLEKAIRTAPASEYARNAYNLLEQKMHESYPKTSGDLPGDVREHLQMLEELIQPGRARADPQRRRLAAGPVTPMLVARH